MGTKADDIKLLVVFLFKPLTVHNRTNYGQQVISFPGSSKQYDINSIISFSFSAQRVV